MTTIVRFAPSPTGMLHIGNARSAVFNYLFAKKTNGKFILRIEDTDLQRSTNEAKEAIIEGLSWLGLSWNELIYQSSREARHKEIAMKLLQDDKAYYAYDTKEELENEKNLAENQKIPYKYNGTKWKNGEKRENILPVIRLNIPKGKTKIQDLVFGDIEFDNDTIEDFVLLRSDGTPTYMLAVVVDDIDMKITHIIRGDDHISNTPKQAILYDSIGGKVPFFAHLPLIHDAEGKKLSKRRNPVAVRDYRNMGYLPEALFNYLLHLGWNDGSEKEIYSYDEAIKSFDINKIRKSPSRFDFNKLENINLHYIQSLDENNLLNYVYSFVEKEINRELSIIEKNRIKNLSLELRKNSNFKNISQAIIPFLEDFKINITVEDRKILKENEKIIENIEKFLKKTKFSNFKEELHNFIELNHYKMKDIGQLLRFLLLGTWKSFGIVLIVDTLGKNEVLERISENIQIM